jgi:DNA-directed RNA polymerase subunit M/transcription elongation factor TFIIS
MKSVVAPRKTPITVRFLQMCPECKSMFSFKKVEENNDGNIFTTSKYECNKCGHSETWTCYPKYVIF